MTGNPGSSGASGTAGTTGAPIGTVTCLFTDIEGSTRLEIELGTGPYRDIRERHRELVRAAFTAHGGYEQSTEGDSFFVIFRGATDAVMAAADAQRAMAAEPWPDGVVVRVRMGLHTGDIEATGADVIGYAINRTARIAAVAHGGQVLLSDQTRSLVAGSLPDGITLRDLGEHRLKDLRAPERHRPARHRGRAGRLPAAAVAGRPAEQPADPAHDVRRPRQGARRGRGAAGRDPAAEPDRTRRHRQDPALAAGRGGRSRRIPGRDLVRGARTGPRPDPGGRHDRAGARRGGQPQPPGRGHACRPHRGAADAAGPGQLRAGRGGGIDRRGPPPALPDIWRAWSRPASRCGCRANRSTRCRASPPRPTRAGCPRSTGSTSLAPCASSISTRSTSSKRSGCSSRAHPRSSPGSRSRTRTPRPSPGSPPDCTACPSPSSWRPRGSSS